MNSSEGIDDNSFFPINSVEVTKKVALLSEIDNVLKEIEIKKCELIKRLNLLKIFVNFE